MTKTSLRMQFLLQRETISEEDRKRKSEAIRKQISILPEFQSAKTILLFFPFRGEPDIFTLLHEFPKKTYALPYISPKDHLLIPKKVETLETLISGKYGILCPSESAEEMPNDSFDLLFIPAIAVDANTGFRIGFGKGYYDRFLHNISGIKLAPCFESSILTNSVHHFDAHDIPMDRVVTEKKTYQIAPKEKYSL